MLNLIIRDKLEIDENAKEVIIHAVSENFENKKKRIHEWIQNQQELRNSTDSS